MLGTLSICSGLQVCTQGIARSGDRTVKPWAGVEAVASLALHHRGVMRTLNHTTVVVPAPPPRNTSVRHASLHILELNNSAGCVPAHDRQDRSSLCWCAQAKTSCRPDSAHMSTLHMLPRVRREST